MEIFRSDFNLSDFFDKLRKAKSSLLMLDYDGTLSPFTADRDKAVPYEGIMPLLEEISRTDSVRCVIISGRSIEMLQKLLGGSVDLELWGSHGAERYRPGQGISEAPIDSAVDKDLSAIDKFAHEANLVKHLEQKPHSRAFHWRGLPSDEAESIERLVSELWQDRCGDYNLALHKFDGGLELRPAGISKADAVKALLKESRDDSVAAYLGDDLTDEDAFAALGEHGLKVLVRRESRETAADIRLDPPSELLDFLQKWQQAASQEIS